MAAIKAFLEILSLYPICVICSSRAASAAVTSGAFTSFVAGASSKSEERPAYSFSTLAILITTSF